MFRVLSYIGELYERKKWEWRKFLIKIAPNSKVYFFIDTLYKQKLRLLLCFIRVFFVFRVFLFLWNSTLWFLFLLPNCCSNIIRTWNYVCVRNDLSYVQFTRGSSFFFFWLDIYVYSLRILSNVCDLANSSWKNSKYKLPFYRRFSVDTYTTLKWLDSGLCSEFLYAFSFPIFLVREAARTALIRRKLRYL